MQGQCVRVEIDEADWTIKTLNKLILFTDFKILFKMIN